MGAAPWNVSLAATYRILLFLCLLQGCTVGPDYARPEDGPADRWHQAATKGLTDGKADIRTWWTHLDDVLLSELIESSSSGNFDVKQARARVLQSRALRAIAVGEKYPDIDGTGSIVRSRESEDITPVLGPGLSRSDTFYTAGVAAFWEIDLWGRIRRNIESADYTLEASIEDYRDVLVVLYADIAINYVQMRTLQARIRFAKDNIDRQEATLALTNERFKAGLVPRLDVRQAELNLARTKSLIPRLKEFLKLSMHRVEVLVGDHPGSLYERFHEIRTIPKPPGQIGVGIPADIIRQRPDIRRAERQLAAQTAQVGVATALLYPQFELTGDFLFISASGSFSNTFSRDNTAWSVGPSFRQNIFDGDRIRSNIKLQEFLTEEAYYNYEQTLLLALEEVENAMVAYVEETNRKTELADSVTAAEQSVELVMTLYRTGLTDFQNVLDMERSLFEQQDQFAVSEGTVVINLVSLYRALGGGWSAESDEAAIEEEIAK